MLPYTRDVKNLINDCLRLIFCEVKNLQLSICAQPVEEIKIRTWEIARDRQIRICLIALQPRRIRNCPDTPQGHMRLPTKLPFLAKLDLKTDVFSR